MGLFNRIKLKKIKRSEVVDTIVELNKQQDILLSQKEENTKKIESLFNQGKNSTDKQEQLWCAKQINVLKKENKSTMSRLMYLSSNISMLNQLKSALDEKDFIKINKNMSLNKLFDKPQDLSAFLKKLNSEKMMHESKMAHALEAFDEAEATYEENEAIFGESQSDNELLAMFEYAAIEDMGKPLAQSGGQSFEDLVDSQEQNQKRKVTEDGLV
ncbi:MAG: hypothetical protein IJW82_04150 [Clostridia bacterium]|nr:hypothetical protein [Clostridia bacterium]